MAGFSSTDAEVDEFNHYVHNSSCLETAVAKSCQALSFLQDFPGN